MTAVQCYTSTMALKRKRSESSLSPMPGPSPFNNPPTNSSLGSESTIVINNFPPQIETSQQIYHDVPHLHSRTRKRFRDNRPDDDTIHSRRSSLFRTVVDLLTDTMAQEIRTNDCSPLLAPLRQVLSYQRPLTGKFSRVRNLHSESPQGKPRCINSGRFQLPHL